MNKQEKKDLIKYGVNPNNIIKPNGQVVNGLIIMSNGRKELHDSGFPFIRIYGEVKDGLVDLGWHDHWISYVPTNTDSYGKNIFHVFPWLNKCKQWKIRDDFFSCSSFSIGEYRDNEEFVILS